MSPFEFSFNVPKEMDHLNKINIEPLTLLRPVISGLIMTAYYSLLNHRQREGIQLTDEEKQQALNEVFDIFGKIDNSLLKMFEVKRSTLQKTP